MTVTGQECDNDTATDISEESFTYTSSELQNIFWWFGQDDRESKATLAELNTVVRFCDEDDYTAGNTCSDVAYEKFEYQPAGSDWDQGLLIRTKYDDDGDIQGRTIMQKSL